MRWFVNRYRDRSRVLIALGEAYEMKIMSSGPLTLKVSESDGAAYKLMAEAEANLNPELSAIVSNDTSEAPPSNLEPALPSDSVSDPSTAPVSTPISNIPMPNLESRVDSVKSRARSE